MQTYIDRHRAVRAFSRASIAGVVTGVIACMASPTFAQSSVTLYGLIDTGVRYTTHANKAGDDKWQVMSSGASESHFGIKGSEDLGDGLRAVFQLEDRFFVNSGQ